MTDRTTRNPKYIAILALASAAILVVGIVLKPQPNPAEPTPPPPSETDLLGLARMSQRRSLENMTAYFGYVADEAARSLVRLPEVPTVAVPWVDHIGVAPIVDRANQGLPPAAGDEALASAPIMADPRLPLLAIEMPTDRLVPPIPRAETPPAPGDWVIAVWTTGSGRAFAPGTFVGTTPARCGQVPVREISTSVSPVRAMSGAVLVTADGALVGVILPCPERMMAVSPADVDAMVEMARSLDGRLLAAWGFRADTLTPDEAAFFKLTNGVLVRELWQDSPGDRAGLRPGDILLAIDGTPVDALASVQSLVTAAAPVLTLKRGAATRTIHLVRDAVEPPEADVPALGLSWEPPRPAYPVESVVPGSAAADAGIRAGDLLLRINDAEPRDVAEVRRLLARSAPGAAFIELQRGDRRWGVLLR